MSRVIAAIQETALRDESSDNAEAPSEIAPPASPPENDSGNNTAVPTTGAIIRPGALVEINSAAIRTVAIAGHAMIPRYVARLDASVALSDSDISLREELNILKSEIAELKKQIAIADECDAKPDSNKRKLQL